MLFAASPGARCRCAAVHDIVCNCVQEAAVWVPKGGRHQHQQHELMTVRLALARGVAHAHLHAFQPTVNAEE